MMRLPKHLGATAALLLALMLATTGAALGQQTVELTFWTFVDAHADFFLDRAEEFNAANSDYRIVLNPITMPYEEMHNQLLIALQTGIEAPDMVDIEITPFSRYLRDPIQLMDLTDLVEPHIDNIIANRLTPYSRDGRVYGVPTHLGAFLAFYNTEVMEAAGVDIEAIETWSDFVEAGKKVTADTDGDGEIDRWMIMLDGNGWFQWWGLIQQRGSGQFDADGNVIVDNETNIEVLEFLHSLVYEHGIALKGTGLHDAQAYNMINAGQIGAVIMPQWYSIRFTEFMPDLHGKVAVRPLPAWEPGGDRSAMGGGTGTALTNYINPSKVQAARAFLEFAKLSYDANVKIWTEFGFDPFRHDVFDDPELQKPLPYFSNEVVFNVIKDVYDEINPQYLSPVFQEANWDVLQPEALSPVISENVMSPREALERAANRIRELLSRVN